MRRVAPAEVEQEARSLGSYFSQSRPGGVALRRQTKVFRGSERPKILETKPPPQLSLQCRQVGLNEAGKPLVANRYVLNPFKIFGGISFNPLPVIKLFKMSPIVRFAKVTICN